MPCLSALRFPLACLFVVLFPGTLLACTEIALNEPAAGTRVRESVLNLRWQALPDVAEYRLQAEGRQPEGGIEWTLDLFVNGPAYRLDVPATVKLMAVKLRVSVGCDAEDSSIRSQPAHVLIDRR